MSAGRNASWLVLVGFGIGALVLTVRAAARPPASDGAAPLLVTSSFGAASALLFVVDPKSQTLVGYEAVPGAEGGLRLLGARKISLDLELARYRDLSEWSYRELRERYQAGTETLELDRKGVQDR
jgi:hypothetical protein